MGIVASVRLAMTSVTRGNDADGGYLARLDSPHT